MKQPASIAVGFARLMWSVALYIVLITFLPDFRPVIALSYVLICVVDTLFFRYIRRAVYNVAHLGAKYWWSWSGFLCWWQVFRWHRTVLPGTIELGGQTLALKVEHRHEPDGVLLMVSCRPAEADGDLIGFGYSAGEVLVDLRRAYQDLLNFCDT